ncbi:hypothetical protein M2352_002598 [Azospirillum fermentarium]|nr:hypothetical protein [Azospirillum fermentarium]MCW2247007.1 hypothetical protein [Azospirillum fermentarium]
MAPAPMAVSPPRRVKKSVSCFTASPVGQSGSRVAMGCRPAGRSSPSSSLPVSMAAGLVAGRFLPLAGLPAAASASRSALGRTCKAGWTGWSMMKASR